MEVRGEACHITTMIDITERKRAEEQLRITTEQLRSLSARLQSIREEERTLIARELHDELGQALTGLKMDLSWLSRKIPKDQEVLFEKIGSMSKLIDATIQTVRRISSELRPGILDDLGLIAAVEWLARDFENRTGITCEFDSSLEEVEIDKDRSTAVFRILQETLTNVVRHAKATKVTILVEEEEGHFILKVFDNGLGIRERDILNPKSLGLLGMRERAHLFGGTVEFKGAPREGTTVTVKIPLIKDSNQ
jgi:signal transduction histidine kinase